MYELTDIKPIQLNDLVRIGRPRDGGYVVTQRQLDKTEILLSFGINSDWSFENDFLHKRGACRLYAYDYSVSSRILQKRIIKALFSAMHKVVTLDFNAAKERIGFAVEKTIHPFQRFFNPAKNRYFLKKYLGSHDHDEYVSVDSIFRHIYPPHNSFIYNYLAVFIKMDIEGSEYRTLPAFKPFYHLINGFVIEFHDLDILGNNFTEIVREMSEYFYVAHVHANNYGGYIYPTTLPVVLEITFINKKLGPGIPAGSTYSYPISGLDFACNPKVADTPIVF
jgi:hypothetical protein